MKAPTCGAFNDTETVKRLSARRPLVAAVYGARGFYGHRCLIFKLPHRRNVVSRFYLIYFLTPL